MLDTTRNIFNLSLETQKHELKDSLQKKYGEMNFNEKFQRYMALQKPALSVVGEYSFLLEDVSNAYIMGNFYASLTGACCLGERIFNQIIFAVKKDFKSSHWYKKVYGRGSIIGWSKAIQILKEWNIIDDELEKKYLKLSQLRKESIHYQPKAQDIESMSLEAINIMNFIIEQLFGLSRKDILLVFDVPGEIYIKKEAEQLPLVKAFYIPASAYVGYKHKIANDPAAGKWIIRDPHTYEDKEITDEEFVKLRKEYLI